MKEQILKMMEEEATPIVENVVKMMEENDEEKLYGLVMTLTLDAQTGDDEALNKFNITIKAIELFEKLKKEETSKE